MDDLMQALGAAITTREDLNKLAIKHRLTLPAVAALVPQLTPALLQSTGLHTYTSETAVWPLQRDMLREQKGYYPMPTEVLKWLREFRHLQVMFPHIAHDDPTMIAYSADLEGAIKDKKVRITMGRFLHKFFPLFTDNAVRQLEAMHRAELDPTLEILHTVEEIAKVYMGGMAGDSGCMRHSLGHFGHRQYHPSAIYASPGFGLAIHRDANGHVKSRSVVWVNPENEKDKRFVRIYGDQALHRKLERAGYQIRGLRGAKVRALVDPKWAGYEKDRFVMPYVDPAGGINYHGEKALSYDARYVVRYDDDPDWLLFINADDVTKLRRLGVVCVDCSTQHGSIVVPVSSHAEIMVTCMLSGTRFSRFDRRCYQWMDADGKIGWVLEGMLPTSGLETRNLGTKSALVTVYGTKESFAGRCLPNPYEGCIDSPDTMRYMRLCRLSPQYYPEDGNVRSSNDCVDIGGIGDPTWVISKDSYQVMEHMRNGQLDYTTRFIHKRDLKLMRTMGYLSVTPLHRMKTMVHKNDPRMVYTPGGKRALKEHHDLMQLWDDRWEFTRNCVNISIGGFNLYVIRGNPLHMEAAVVPDRMLMRGIFLGNELLTLGSQDVRRQFIRYFGRFVYAQNGQVTEFRHGQQEPTVEAIAEAARILAGMTREQVAEVHWSVTALNWARSVMRCMELDEQHRQRAYAKAEAEAQEVLEWRSSEHPGVQAIVDGEYFRKENYDEELIKTMDNLLAQPTTTFMRTLVAGDAATWPHIATATTSAATATTTTGINPAAAWPYPIPLVPIAPPRPLTAQEELIQSLINTIPPTNDGN